ncbi:hypothetical protein MJM95_31780, partial [Salmonella enterica subsp. enterica serovar Anatum]|nr:hypothetical protein [Salmonella enterica subsp. enterica serovar Anatum]
SSRKLFGTPLPELLSYFSLNIDLMRESLAAGQGFTDNEVTLVPENISPPVLILTHNNADSARVRRSLSPPGFRPVYLYQYTSE